MITLGNKDKKTLLFFITGLFINVAVAIYLIVNSTNVKETIKLNRKTYIIYTGGDIEESFEKKYQNNKNNLSDFEVNIYDNLLNSGDTNADIWNQIAKDIGDNYNKYDAFIVITGSGTLPYIASALSFMIENLSKPIIFTDGKVYNALEYATSSSIPEVMVLDKKDNLLRACKTITTSTDSGGFESQNYSPLNKTNSLKKIDKTVDTQIHFLNPNIKIAVVKVHPGIDEKFLKMLKNTNLNGIILETYSKGEMPIDDKILSTINDLAKKGVVIIDVSQCSTVNAKDTQLRLLEAGVLYGADMTTPAAFTKLHYLLSNVDDKKLIGKLLEIDMRGEMARNKIN